MGWPLAARIVVKERQRLTASNEKQSPVQFPCPLCPSTSLIPDWQALVSLENGPRGRESLFPVCCLIVAIVIAMVIVLVLVSSNKYILDDGEIATASVVLFARHHFKFFLCIELLHFINIL